MAHRVDHPTEDGTRKTSIYITKRTQDGASMIGLSKEGFFLLLSRVVVGTGGGLDHAFLSYLSWTRTNHQLPECKTTVVRYCKSEYPRDFFQVTTSGHRRFGSPVSLGL